MNNRERAMAVLNYEKYDTLPLVHFGFWNETLDKWAKEGHLAKEEAAGWGDGNAADRAITAKLGFDFNWYSCYHTNAGLLPTFEYKVLERFPNGTKKVINGDGAIVIEKDDVTSIPSEVDHLLKDRASWEELYLPKLQYSEDRIDFKALETLKDDTGREIPKGFHCGSLFGTIRNWMGIEGISYLYADDEDLYDEIINTVGDLAYKIAEKVLSTGAKFDFGHFWEDICFKNGPLVKPAVFHEKVGPYYKKLTKLMNDHVIHIISLDCDGMID